MRDISKESLEELYLTQLKTPYEIADILGVNHKTVRAHLKRNGIPMRTASEYNYIPRASHTCPGEAELLTPLSIAAHIAYLCEGWTTDRASMFYFTNQDTVLVDMIIQALCKLYQVKTVRIIICAGSRETAEQFYQLYPDASFILDKNRRKAIIRVVAGGKSLARDFIRNAYRVIEAVSR